MSEGESEQSWMRDVRSMAMIGATIAGVLGTSSGWTKAGRYQEQAEVSSDMRWALETSEARVTDLKDHIDALEVQLKRQESLTERIAEDCGLLRPGP